MSTRDQEIQDLERAIQVAKPRSERKAGLIGRLQSLRTRKINEEAKMAEQQEARDANGRQEIALSCSVILRHASFIGVEAEKMVRLRHPELCMDELNEAQGVLQRALDRIDRAKDVLLMKSGHSVAAE